MHSAPSNPLPKTNQLDTAFPDVDAINRLSKAKAREQKKSANRQRQSRQQRSKDAELERVEDAAAISTEFRRRRVENATWREIRLMVVERYFEERQKPDTLKSSAVESAAAHCEVSPRFVRAWVNRFLGKGNFFGNTFWNTDNWGAHPKIRWQLQSEEARHCARTWVRQHAAPKTGKHMTEYDFMKHVNETIIPQYFVPEDSYRCHSCSR